MSAPTPRDEAAKALKLLCDKVPRAYPEWDYKRVVDFKEANAKARRVSTNKRATLGKIQGQTLALQNFHGGAK